MPIPCLVTGSRIRTAQGEIAIEDIFAGDEIVILRDGVETTEPVKWVGNRHLDMNAHARPELSVPVRIRANAIAEGQPVRDLFLSQDHCLFLDGRCVPARLLVNGGSITFERETRSVRYYHIELEKHGVMLAEGLPTETYLDTGNRDQFANNDGPVALHPTFLVNSDSSAWLTDACAPLATSKEELEPIWNRLAARSEALGHTSSAARTTQDADLRLVADGIVLRPVESQEGVHSFVVPAGTRSVSLESRFCIPVDVAAPYMGDTRRLGVKVTSVTMRSDLDETVITADDPALTTGWYDVERQDAKIWRWTDGSARLPWARNAKPAVVTIHCTLAAAYPFYDEMARLVA